MSKKQPSSSDKAPARATKTSLLRRYGPLLLLAIFLAAAPWPLAEEPHLVEKYRMWQSGDLHRAIDIIDIPWHLAGFIALAAMVAYDRFRKGSVS